MARVRVVLQWLQILDSLDVDDKGEFVFHSKVSSSNGDQVQEKRMPEEGHWVISDYPGQNILDKLERVLFEGDVIDHLKIELIGEELDKFSDNDFLDIYQREFNGPIEEYFGLHHPGDEGDDDPENMANWRIAYRIESV